MANFGKISHNNMKVTMESHRRVHRQETLILEKKPSWSKSHSFIVATSNFNFNFNFNFDVNFNSNGQLVLLFSLK